MNTDLYDTDVSKSSSSRSSVKSCLKSESSKSITGSEKHVIFDLIEIKEHPRVLGDHPTAKKGPALSLGWY